MDIGSNVDDGDTVGNLNANSCDQSNQHFIFYNCKDDKVNDDDDVIDNDDDDNGDNLFL